MGLEREDGPMVDAGEHPEMLAEVFEWNVEASRLLPIGSVNARLLLSEDQPRWMALNVRTYIAEFPKHEDESLRPSRYQLRMWPAGGGETEVEELRREIGRLGTDRLMTTRILDLNMASVERMAWFEPDGHEYTGYADSVMDGRRPAAEVTEEYRKTTAVVALESDDLWNPNWGELRGDRGEGE